jgi:hypothetical protein
VKVNPRFGGIFGLNLQGRSVSKAGNQNETGGMILINQRRKDFLSQFLSYVPPFTRKVKLMVMYLNVSSPVAWKKLTDFY